MYHKGIKKEYFLHRQTLKQFESEIVKDYKYLKEELLSLGYTIQSATLEEKSVSTTTGELHFIQELELLIEV